MKVEGLEEGKIYKCRLSKQDVLVVKAKRETKAATKKAGAETEDITAGKACVMREGMPQFMHIELHDGQLEEIKNEES